MASRVSDYVDNNKVRVVTRKEYAELGEYVANPITSISVTRSSNSLNVGDTDSKNEYTVIATYADGTSSDVTAEAIVEFIADTSEAKLVQVPAYYRGFTATIQVEVISGSSSILEPTILVDKKLSTSDGNVVTGYGAKIYVYDCAGLDKIYITSSHNHQYLVGWSAEIQTEGILPIFEKPYFNPSRNPNEVSVADGMRYFYINSAASNGMDVYPWSVSSVATV